MARQHDTSKEAGDFLLNLGAEGWPAEAITNALLADIRRELKQLNRTLGCHNVVGGMVALQRLDRRAAKHWPLTRRKK